MIADHLRMLHAYNTWANSRVLDRVALVAAADYHAPIPGLNFGSLHATLVHVLVGELVWLARWQGDEPPEALKDARQADRLGMTELPTLTSVRSVVSRPAAVQPIRGSLAWG